MEKAGHVLNPFATFAHNGRWYYVDKTGEVHRADLLRQVPSPRSRGSLSWDTLGVYMEDFFLNPAVKKAIIFLL